MSRWAVIMSMSWPNQRGSVAVMPETLSADARIGIVEQDADRQLHDIAIDEPDQAELFGDRHEMGRGDHRAVEIGHPQQAPHA